jgi:hypothetical protein
MEWGRTECVHLDMDRRRVKCCFDKFIFALETDKDELWQWNGGSWEEQGRTDVRT